MINAISTKKQIRALLVIVALGAACSHSGPSLPAPTLSATPSPTSSPAADATPETFTTQERIEAMRRLTSKDIAPRDAEETRQLVDHLEVLSKGNGSKSRFFSKMTPAIKRHLATLIEAQKNPDSARLCAADSESEVLQSVKAYLVQTLNDPSSLQDMRIVKCVPMSEKGALVHARVSFRAKNAYGALMLSSDNFIVLRKADGQLFAVSETDVDESK